MRAKSNSPSPAQRQVHAGAPTSIFLSVIVLALSTFSPHVSDASTFNDANWSALGSGVNSRVLSLALSGGNLFAGGDFNEAGGVSANYIAKWNGSSWSAVGSGLDAPVYAVAVSGNNVYAGGDFSMAGGLSANAVGQWDGSSWSALGSGISGGYVCI